MHHFDFSIGHRHLLFRSRRNHRWRDRRRGRRGRNGLFSRSWLFGCWLRRRGRCFGRGRLFSCRRRSSSHRFIRLHFLVTPRFRLRRPLFSFRIPANSSLNSRVHLHWLKISWYFGRLYVVPLFHIIRLSLLLFKHAKQRPSLNNLVVFDLFQSVSRSRRRLSEAAARCG